jgi:subtilisin family serine protease
VEAWDWCVNHQNDDPSNPIMIISTSFGGDRFYNQSTCDSVSSSMAAAAANAVSAGITLFVATGNDGYCDSTGWPGCMSDVIGVGAVYDADTGRYPPSPYVGCIASGSCTGYTSGCPCPGKCYVDSTTAGDQVTSYSNSASFMGLFAPSNNAYTLDITGGSGYDPGDYYDSFGGTSAASPYAAGAAACLQSAAMAINGAYLSPAAVESYLTNNGDSVTDPKVAITKPRVNLGNAVNALKDGPDDLVYFSVTPCRIADTRFSQGGSGPIIGGTQRSFYATGLCGVPFGFAKAVMINIAATNATGMGNLRAFAYPEPKPFAATSNYGIIPGLNAISNAVVVPICDANVHSCSRDLSIWVSRTTDVVIDVMGYFKKP